MIIYLLRVMMVILSCLLLSFQTSWLARAPEDPGPQPERAEQYPNALHIGEYNTFSLFFLHRQGKTTSIVYITILTQKLNLDYLNEPHAPFAHKERH